MDNYVTETVIKRLRENKKMTQEELAQKIFATSKAVSKWETSNLGVCPLVHVNVQCDNLFKA